MAIELTQPPKICPKCGNEIPVNGYETDSKGKVKLDENKKPIYHERALLICEKCAIAAMPPTPKPRKLRCGETPQGQDKFDITYTLLIR